MQHAVDSGLKAFQAIIDFPTIYQTFVIFDRSNKGNKNIFVIPSVRAFDIGFAPIGSVFPEIISLLLAAGGLFGD